MTFHAPTQHLRVESEKHKQKKRKDPLTAESRKISLFTIFLHTVVQITLKAYREWLSGMIVASVRKGF